MLLSMALCHILPESESMYQALQMAHEKEAEAAEALILHDEHEEEVEGEEHVEEAHEEEVHEEEAHDEHEGEASHGFPLVYVLFFGGFMVMLVLD